MLSLHGNWLHYRSSSNLSELKAVRSLLIESSNPVYKGKSWSAGRDKNAYLYTFASHIGVEPSTMQTKIRAMIRFGFLEDGELMPLKWTKLGSLWNDLYSIGNFKSARQVYEVILTISLALFSFKGDNEYVMEDPFTGNIPLTFLFNSLDRNNSISQAQLSDFIDGKTTRKGNNFAYWKKDLLNAGLFVEKNDRLYYTGDYHGIVDIIKSFSPDPPLTIGDWIEIRKDPLTVKSPFSFALKKTFEYIAIYSISPEDESSLVEPLIDLVASENESIIDDSLDILSTSTRFSTTTKKTRNAIWAKKVKKSYNFMCCVPLCDTQGEIFVTAAHIKPDHVAEGIVPHRSHLLNGISLCRNCHIAFDKGYFALSNKAELLISSKINDIKDQHIKKNIIDSQGKIIKLRSDKRLPLEEFIVYHRQNIFME